MTGMTTMLDNPVHLIFCIIIYQYWIGRRHYPWYLFNNAKLRMGCTFIANGNCSLAALCPIICSTLNGPTYYDQSFPGLAFRFRCIMNNSTFSPDPMLYFLLALSTCSLSASANLISHLWISVHILCKSDR